ncbi:MAG: hypothetical protein KBA90_07090 [Chitinophagaceae bacterium]|nr:hypothetical protein [Chitinophagaceae bacterium]MBP7108311.1 hypothetical protein [Chitinophagaceae bacterium]HQZ49214.1 hypothetical protein [Chitinophagaceae bacterium]
MLIKSFLLIASLSCTISLFSQNYSGLENKKLLRSEDLSSLLESGIGALFGNKLSGEIDSVVVLKDAERILKVRVYYKGYANGFFAVSVMGASREKQNQFSIFQFLQTSNPSVAECIIEMNKVVPDNTTLESPYLRIDISKKKNSTGNVKIFNLNKKWQSTVNNSNIVIDIRPVPIGQAVKLTNEVKDYVPSKTILFDPSKTYLNPRTIERLSPPSGGGSSMNRLYKNFSDVFYAISGSWVNVNETGGVGGVVKINITGESKIKAFGKCSPQLCDWGEKPLIKISASTYRAEYILSFKRTTIYITENPDGTLRVAGSYVYNDGRPTLNFNDIFKREIRPLILNTNLITLKQFALLPPAGNPADKAPKGPDKNSFYLMDGLSADVDFRRPQDISNININVFPDKNVHSGVYYILPADYHLLWESKSEAEKGYEFRILYGAQEAAEGSEAPVRMSATLSAGITNREREFVKELIKSLKPDFKTLAFLPLRENPQFTFQNTLGSQYDIPEDKISTERISDLNSDIRVSWQTDATTKDFIQAAITSREGIGASVILQPEDEDIVDQQIPATINLADIRTLGKMNLIPNLWRTQHWKNETPYPLKLKNIHILKKQVSGSKPIIYSWTLNNTLVPSQSKVNFTGITIPTWLDNDPSSVIWIEYNVEECNECDTKVMDAVTGGVSGTRAQQIKFSIPPVVFDSLNASQIMITLRSAQGDPKGLTVKEFTSLKLTQSVNEGSTGPLYLPASSSLQYEYKIIIASKDGDFYSSNTWIPGNELENYLGKTQLKQLFIGIIPGLNN